jgi:hypothetical protein
MQSQLQQQHAEGPNAAHRQSISSNDSGSLGTSTRTDNIPQGRSARGSSNSDGPDLFDDISEMDEDFWKEVDAKDQRNTSENTVPRQNMGRMTDEVIEIEDSDEDEDIIRRPPKRTSKAPEMDTIILSD